MRFYSSFVLIFFFFLSTSLSENQNHGFSVKLISPDSTESPFFNPTYTQFQRVSNIVNYSISRVRYLNHVFSFSRNNMPQTTVTPYMGSAYVMSYSIGTPPFQLYGIVDTGSDLSWFQCKSCKPCFNQTSPMFDPSKSSTYKTVHCSSPTCKNVDSRSCSSDGKNKCEYDNLYVDKSFSQGDVSVDTLTLNSETGSPIKFPRFVIGCGVRNNQPSLQGNVSGVIGLGSGSLSLISQLGSSIGGKFSYCLVPFFSKFNISSKLNFGDTAVVSGRGTITTPIPKILSNISYFVTLEAFSVGDHIIEMENSLKYGKLGNIVIDSGSTLTSVPKNVYSRLESAMAAMVKLKRVKDPTKQLSLCYKSTIDMLDVPIIIAHFSGGDVKLNAMNTFIQVDHEVVCFAFVGNKGAIFGSIAQHNFLVGFDIIKNIVSFKPTDCTKQ